MAPPIESRPPVTKRKGQRVSSSGFLRSFTVCGCVTKTQNDKKRKNRQPEQHWERERCRDARFCVSTSLTLPVLICRLRVGLEVKLQRELNDARGRRRDADRAERAACDVQAGYSEVGMVERVEEFGAELEVLRLGHMQVFRQREIEVDQTRAAHHADAGSPEDLPLVRVYRRECGGVEPLVNGLRPVRVSDQIRAAAP